jgi:TonB family protein
MMQTLPVSPLTESGVQGNLPRGLLCSSLACIILALLFLLVRLPEVVPPLPVWVVGLLDEGELTGRETAGEEMEMREFVDEAGLPLQSERGPLAPEGIAGGRQPLESTPRTRAASPPTGGEAAPSRSWRPFVREEASVGAPEGHESDWYAVEGPLQHRSILAAPVPQYPPGVQVEGKVRVHVRVAPSGEVLGAFAVERGHAALDSAAVAGLHQWRFAPLPSEASQVDQEGDVTFFFQLALPEDPP